MAVNKVVMNTENGEKTLVDLTEDTVTADTLAEGATAHDASGNIIKGRMPKTMVLYTEQTLTEAQKEQARRNIGAQAELTEADKEAIVQDVIAALGTPVFGTIGDNKKITLSTEHLADGTYEVGYEDKDGNWVEIGILSNISGPVEIPLTWAYGSVLDKTTGKVSSTGNNNYSASNYTEVNPGKTYTITRDSYMYNTCNLVWYDANNNFVSYLDLQFASINASGGSGALSRQLTIPANAAKFRLRLWYEATQNAETVAAMYHVIEE